MTTCSPDKSRTASAVLSYLSGHPDAADTLDGIGRWWRKERKSELPPVFLREVLSDLVTQGLVEAVRVDDGAVRYRSRGAHRK